MGEPDMDADEMAALEAEGASPDDSGRDKDKEDTDSEFEVETYNENEPKREIAKKEKERLRQLKKHKEETLKALRDKQNTAVGAGEAARDRNRMRFLLSQTEIFKHFMSKAALESARAPPSAAAAGPSGRGDRPGGSSRAGRGRHKHAEADEDNELLEDEDADGADRHYLTVQPSCIQGKMRDYQMQGLNWLIHLFDKGVNGILADEMGLGKTLQTISLLGYLAEHRGIKGPHLVIVPKSTMGNWMNEFKRFCPMLRVFKFHGDATARAEQAARFMGPNQFDVIVTSYEMIIKEKGLMRRVHWMYVIIDEAHRIKNENSRLGVVVRQLRARFRLLITGTPLQNNLHELWALLNFLMPEVFGSAEQFDDWFKTSDSATGEEQKEVVQKLHQVLRPFLLRRLKADVEKTLPPKKETILKVGMSEMQKKFYRGLLQKDMDAINGGADRSRLLNIVMQLRKCCNHPYLFQGAEPGPPYTTGDHLCNNAGKMVLLDRLLPKLAARGSRVLIFSQMTRMLDILEDYLQYRQHAYCRIDGNTDGELRDAQIEAYNAPGSPKFVFLLSTRAGGLGINLATADTVILYDSDWNPQMDLQAMDRAHRIGQTREVQVFRFCTDGAIEEKVIEKAYKKLALDALVIQQGRLTDAQHKVGKEDLHQMVRYGAERIFSSVEGTITEDDVDTIIAKGEAATRQLTDRMQAFSNNAMNFALDGGAAVYDYAEEEPRGEALEGGELRALISNNWIDPPKRERKRLGGYGDAGDAAKGGARPAAKPPGPRLPRMPQLADFQFFNLPRITALYEKENAHLAALEAAKAAAGGAGAAPGPAAASPVGACAPGEIPPALTAEEDAERQRLLTEGFTAWSRKEFQAFVRGCEKYGRDNVAAISAEVGPTKTETDVITYRDTFFARITELTEHERVLRNIERGETKVRRQRDILVAVNKKLSRYTNPWRELRMAYGQAKGKAYTEDEDRFLLCMTAKLGYGNWEQLKHEIRQSALFRFDWFLKSRLPIELNRRADTLIRCVEKELDEAEHKAGGGAGNKAAAPGSAVKAEEGGAGPAGPPRKGAAGGKRKADDTGAAGGAGPAAGPKKTKA